jgi:hypothetical protein
MLRPGTSSLSTPLASKPAAASALLVSRVRWHLRGGRQLARRTRAAFVKWGLPQDGAGVRAESLGD